MSTESFQHIRFIDGTVPFPLSSLSVDTNMQSMTSSTTDTVEWVLNPAPKPAPTTRQSPIFCIGSDGAVKTVKVAATHEARMVFAPEAVRQSLRAAGVTKLVRTDNAAARRAEQRRAVYGTVAAVTKHGRIVPTQAEVEEMKEERAKKRRRKEMKEKSERQQPQQQDEE